MSQNQSHFRSPFRSLALNDSIPQTKGLIHTSPAATPRDPRPIFDLEGRFLYANPSLLTLWGKTLDEAVGKNFLELEVLKWIRGTPSFCTLPVIMLTSSNQNSDIHRAYILGANSYLIKPGKPDQLVTMVNLIKEFWLRLNQSSQL